MLLNEGTPVWLKIGSPEMSVKSKTKKNTYYCTWYVGNELNEYEFSAEDLTTEDPSKRIPKKNRKPMFVSLFW